MLRRLAILLILGMTTTPLSAQWLNLKTPGIPRTADGKPDLSAPAPKSADGHPDLSGLWVPVDATGSLFDSSKIQKWALDAMAAQERDFYRNDPRFHCLPSGPGNYPAGRSVGGMRRIVQHPDFMAVLNYDMTYRQIFLDGRALDEKPWPTWEGYSVGHWEGDTLVVQSKGFNNKTWLTREGLPHTEQLQITERYRRPDFGHINLEITYRDPGTFNEPVKAVINMEYRADGEILEIVCAESETGRSHWNGAITQAETKVVQVPEETLKKYVGTYQGIWLGRLITAEAVIENGEMFLIRTPRYSDTGGNTDSAKYRLIPQSETAFDCSCGLGFVFKADDDGVVREVSEVHVSGAWPFKRVE